jgi:hypothetical protein
MVIPIGRHNGVDVDEPDAVAPHAARSRTPTAGGSHDRAQSG